MGIVIAFVAGLLLGAWFSEPVKSGARWTWEKVKAAGRWLSDMIQAR